VAYGNGLFVVIGNSQLMTSPDGITWTSRAGANGQFMSVTYGGGMFVGVSYFLPAGQQVVTNGTFDTTAPGVPSITAGPADGSATSDTAPGFSFSATDDVGGSGVASYECRLDGPGGAVGTWAACASPRSYTSLADGAYTFNVRAIDNAANTGAVRLRSWTVDTIAPGATAILSGPEEGGRSGSTSAAFVMSASDPGGTGVAGQQVVTNGTFDTTAPGVPSITAGPGAWSGRGRTV
jgi:hypothetical protein